MTSEAARASQAAAISIAVAALVLALKAAGWWITGSIALYSDALESVVNIAAAAAAFWAMRVAAKPPDAGHPFGHDKAEFFAAVFEGALIVVAAVLILQEAWHGWWSPRPLALPWRGLALSLLATLVNLGWGLWLRRLGRQTRSPALAADGQHLLTDVITSLGIVLGVAAVALTGRLWLDPLLAAAVACYVLWAGTRLIQGSVAGLMDAAAAPEIIARIRAVVAEYAAGAIEAHDLRTRHAGRMSFLEFHLVVPGAMTVAESHDICDRIEAALKAEMAGLTVTIHVEPEAKAKHQGVLVL